MITLTNEGCFPERLKKPELYRWLLFPGMVLGKHKEEVVVKCQPASQQDLELCVYFSPLTKWIFKAITLEEAVALLELYLVVMVISFSWAIYFIFVSKPLFGKN